MILLKKKETFEIEPLKKTISDETGRPLVLINLQTPRISGKSPFATRFGSFYGAASKAFLHFAETDLTSLARTHPENEPCGAVEKTVLRLETKDFLSLTVDHTVFDGVSTLPAARHAAVWDKKKGVPLGADTFFTEECLAYVRARFSEENPGRKRKADLRRDSFYLTPSGVCFFLTGGQSLFLPYAVLFSKNFLTKCALPLVNGSER